MNAPKRTCMYTGACMRPVRVCQQPNSSLDTETQLQAAASPHVLRAGQLRR
jgi:hypothetical protein